MKHRTFKELTAMKPVVPPPTEWQRSSVTLPKALWHALETELDAVNHDRQNPDKLSRDAFVRLLLEWSIEEVREQRKKSR